MCQKTSGGFFYLHCKYAQELTGVASLVYRSIIKTRQLAKNNYKITIKVISTGNPRPPTFLVYLTANQWKD